MTCHLKNDIWEISNDFDSFQNNASDGVCQIHGL